jgi:hypothetical protein
MRQIIANIVTWSIGALLVLGAAGFAWMRSAQVALTEESELLFQYQPEPVNGFDWKALGARSYVANCLACHGADGRGWDQYPGLGHTAELFNAPGGRAYVINLHLYGLTSERWRAPMPPMGHLHDIETAAVINHVLTNFGNAGSVADAELVTPREVSAQRDERPSPWQVNDQRPTVEAR